MAAAIPILGQVVMGVMASRQAKKQLRATTATDAEPAQVGASDTAAVAPLSTQDPLQPKRRKGSLLGGMGIQAAGAATKPAAPFAARKTLLGG